jgi:hypothetical protein
MYKITEVIAMFLVAPQVFIIEGDPFQDKEIGYSGNITVLFYT